MLFALIDCNNFYVSCERAFNPHLEKKPVVVLSNNDGCIISRSDEAKKLNIPMGAPFFKWESFCKKYDVFVFSSNYELYGDMSQRVISLLKEFNSNIEIYSIDEAFLYFNYPISIDEMKRLKEKVKLCTGIPISIGLGKTKTLAKLANLSAKNLSDSGVFYLSESKLNDLSTIPVEKIWGVGYRLAEKLRKLGIDTAKKLKGTDPKIIRLHFNVSLEKTVTELRGIPCLQLEKVKPCNQIISSRSFGKIVTELFDLEEAISYYIKIASRKLRKQKSVASALYVFLQTNIFKENTPHYGNGVVFPFHVPTADTRYLTRIAKKCLKYIYKKNYHYHKAGIMLLDISPSNIRQYDFINEVIQAKSEKIMATMDKINEYLGENTIFLAAEGIEKTWQVKCAKRSSRYTTRWQELPIVFCS